MFKDLMQAIFTEEVEPDEEELEEEKAVVSEPEPVIVQPKPQPQTYVQPSIPVNPPMPAEPEIAQFGQQRPVVKQPKSNIFAGLDVDSISSAEPRNTKKPYRYDRSKTRKVRRTQEDLEYTPIISPIFGNMEESKKDTSKVHNAIDLNKPEQPEDYLTVLSPMYGERTEASLISSPAPEVKPKTVVTRRKSALSLDQMLEKEAPKESKQTRLFSTED